MSWPIVPIVDVAPAQSSPLKFDEDHPVWHLTLDQIERGTGRIINKRIAPAREAGSSSYVFDEKNVLLSKLRPYLNKVVKPDEAGMATTELLPLLPNPEVLDRGYLMYYLRSRRFVAFASQNVSGVKMPRLIMDKFWHHGIPLPPLSEQRRIVELLDQADGLRKSCREADMLAERILPALFHKMFGDPVRNDMEWERKIIRDIITDVQYGISIQAEAVLVDGIAVIRMNNLSYDGGIDLSDLKFAHLSQGELNRHRLRKGDILFNRTNSADLVGKTGIWDTELLAVPASYLIRVRINESMAIPEFVWAYMNTIYMKRQLYTMARRAIGMSNINSKELTSIPIPLPPILLQKQFASNIAQVKKLHMIRGQSKETMEKLFATLLQRAFSGELTKEWRRENIQKVST